MEVFELFEKGGLVMLFILVLSVYSIAVIIYKIFQFWHLKVYNNYFLEELLNAVSKKRISDAKKIAKNNLGIVAGIVGFSLDNFFNKNQDIEKSKSLVAVFGSSQIRKLEKHLNGLEMVANVSPLLGLLGTVIGMVHSFAGIEKAGQNINPSVLAGGIWEALITTVAGLVVAIPALVAYYFIQSKIEEVRNIVRDAVNEIMAHIK